MSFLATLRRYGPRTVVTVFALITIVADLSLFFRELELTQDLPSDAVMARFLPILVKGVFFSGIQVQRITACFTSTTVLVQLAFYIWAVEFFLKGCMFFGMLALLSFNKDFAAKMKARSRDPMAKASRLSYSKPIFWILLIGSIVVGICLRMILNELRKRDREAQSKKEALLRLDKDMPPFPITTAKSSTGSLGEVLTKEETQRRLLQVRSWPRIVTGLVLAMHLCDIVERLFFNQEGFLKFQWHDYLGFAMITIATPMGLYALYRKSPRLSRWYFWAMATFNFHGYCLMIKGLVESYHNSNASSNSSNSRISTTTAIPLPTIESATAKEVSFGEKAADAVISIVLDLLILWYNWQVVKDLQKRNERIAKAKAELRGTESSALIFTDEKITTINNEKGQQSSIVWI